MSTAWKERDEIGNTFWLRVIVWISRSCGRGFAQLCMWPTAVYFFLRRGP
jgi:predicted LPLAT superfamily acyltransferase